MKPLGTSAVRLMICVVAMEHLKATLWLNLVTQSSITGWQIAGQRVFWVLILTVGSLFKRGCSHCSSPNAGWVSVSKVVMPGGRVYSASVGNLLLESASLAMIESLCPLQRKVLLLETSGQKETKRRMFEDLLNHRC